MQFPTHLIAGITIQFILMTFIPTPLWLTGSVIILVSLSSHFILDTLAKSTYHPPQRIYDNFWLAWHIFAYGTGFIIIFLFVWKYWLGMLFAILPDLWDWYTLRRIATKKNQPDWGKKFYIHPVVGKIRSHFFSWLPDLSYNRKGILPELFIVILWFIIIVIYGDMLY